jgi:hypothetical protein
MRKRLGPLLLPKLTLDNSAVCVISFRNLRYHEWMNLPTLYKRRIELRIAEAMLDTSVVLLAGPCKAGKTTLVRMSPVPSLRGL